jgi:elongation factor 1-beta
VYDKCTVVRNKQKEKPGVPRIFHFKMLDKVDVLNGYLEDKSYIEGYTPSQADAVVFKAYSAAPADKYPHALRWYKHISSFAAAIAQFPGQAKPIASYGPTEAAKPAAADEDDIDLFGSDDEEVDEEAEKLKQQRLAEYAAKKAGKVAPTAKSSILLDIKPWDDTTDMKALEEGVRAITIDGLLWGASKLVPVGFGIKKLQISCVVEDAKVSTDDIEDRVVELEDYVQSMDIAAFNKI